MFHVFGEGEIWVKMCKPIKKKSLLVNWEGFYFFLGYKDGKGIQKQDDGAMICFLKDKKIVGLGKGLMKSPSVSW